MMIFKLKNIVCNIATLYFDLDQIEFGKISVYLEKGTSTLKLEFF